MLTTADSCSFHLFLGSHSSTAAMDVMPEEVIAHIIGFLPLEQIFAVRLVDSCWKLAGDKAIREKKQLLVSSERFGADDRMDQSMLRRLWRTSGLRLFSGITDLTVSILIAPEDEDAMAALLTQVSQSVVRLTMQSGDDEWLVNVMAKTSFPALTHLFRRQLTDNLLIQVEKSCPKLLIFSVESREMLELLPEKTVKLSFDDESWLKMEMVTRFKNLISLTITGCRLKPHEIRFTHFSRLTHLEVRDSGLCISDDLIADIAVSCPHIRSLELRNERDCKHSADSSSSSQCLLTGTAIDSLMKMSCLQKVALHSSQWSLRDGVSNWSRLPAEHSNSSLKIDFDCYRAVDECFDSERVSMDEDLNIKFFVWSFDTATGKLLSKGTDFQSMKSLNVWMCMDGVIAEAVMLRVAHKFADSLLALILPDCVFTDKVLAAFHALKLRKLSLTVAGDEANLTADSLLHYLEVKSSDGTLKQLTIYGLDQSFFSPQQKERLTAASKRMDSLDMGSIFKS